MHFASTGLKVAGYLLAVLYLIVGFLLGARHDYIAYGWQWSDVLMGLDPWIQGGVPTTNAYGPFHNAFALLYSWHVLLPKMIFIGAWLAVSFYAALSIQWNKNERPFVLMFFLLNPFFWIEFVSWGHHDAIVAFLVFFAAVEIQKSRQIFSGILIGLAILLKFFPIFLIPFFWIELRRNQIIWNLRFLMSCFITLVVGYEIAYLYWGKSVFYPLLFASNRPPAMLSIFNFFQKRIFDFMPFLPVDQVMAILSFLSKTLMSCGAGFVLFRYLNGKVSRNRAIAAMALVLFLFFQVGHPQFHSSVFFILPLILAEIPSQKERLNVLKPFFFYVGLLIAFQVSLVVFGQYSKTISYLVQWIAIPYLFIGVWTINCLLNPVSEDGRGKGVCIMGSCSQQFLIRSV